MGPAPTRRPRSAGTAATLSGLADDRQHDLGPTPHGRNPVANGPRLPGVAAVVAMTALIALAGHLDLVRSPLTWAVGLGVVAVNVGLVAPALRPGLALVGREGLRVAIVLLGFRLGLSDVAGQGVVGTLAVIGLVLAAFSGIVWLAGRVAAAPVLSLLIAAGSAVCGASAIAAVREVVDAEDEDVAYAVGIITMLGSAAIVVLPLLARATGMPDAVFGTWVGMSVHDVGQVVATASTRGRAVVDVALVTKLTRVAMLAPILLLARLHARRIGALRTDGTRQRPVPLVVVLFLAAVATRSTGIVPDDVATALTAVEGWLMTAAMLAIGTGVHLRRLSQLGGRGLVVALIGFTAMAGVSWLLLISLT